MGEIELFRWDKSTPQNAFAHAATRGGATLTGTVDTHRGIDLAARLDVMALFDASATGGGFTASAAGQVQVHAGIEFAAMFPLDLFGPDGAGLVARVSAELAASAAVGLTVSYSPAALAADMKASGLNPLLADLVDVFLEEVAISAGVWLKGSFAAAVKAQAVLVGTLAAGDPSDPSRTPGFTLTADAYACYGFGGGFQFLVNAGIPDPRALAGRLADVIARRVLTAFDAWSDRSGVPAAAAVAARGAAQVLIPAGLRMAVQTGFDLAAPRSPGATTSVVGGFLTEARDMLFRAVLAAALQELSEFLGVGGLDSLVFADEDPATGVALARVADALDTVTGLDVADPEALLPAVVTLLGALDGVVSLPLVPAALAGAIRPTIGDIYSTVVLLERIWAFAADPDASPADLFAGSPTTTPGPFADQFGGSTPTFGALVARIIDRSGVERLAAAVPAVGATLDWLGEALGVDASAVVTTVLVDLVPPGSKAVDLLTRIGSAATTAGAAAVEHLLDPIRSDPATDPLLADLLTEFVEPLLASLGSVIVPVAVGVAKGDDPGRGREALSMIVMHCVQRLLFGASGVLATAAGAQIGALAGTMADSVHASGSGADGYGAIAGGTVLESSSEDVEALFRLIQGAAPQAGAWFASVDDVIAAAIDLGIVTAAGSGSAVQKALGGDGPLFQERLEAAADRCRDDGNALAQTIGNGGVELFERWIAHRIEALGLELEHAMEAVVAAVVAVIDEVEAAIQQLDDVIRDLEQQVDAALIALGREIDALLEHAEVVVTAAVEAVRAWLHGAVHVIVPAGAIRDAVDCAVDDVLDAAEDFEKAILESLEYAVEVMRAELGDAAATRQITRSGLDRAARTALGSSVPEMVVDIDLLFFTIRLSLPTPSVASVVGNAFLAGPDYAEHTQAGLDHANTAGALRQQRSTAKQQQADDQHLLNAKGAAVDIVPALTPTIRIVRGTDSTTGAQPVSIQIDGVNRTFVDPYLAVAPRVLVRIGGVTIPIDWTRWFLTGTQQLTFQVLLRPGPLPSAVPRVVRSAASPSRAPAAIASVAVPHDVLDPEIGGVGFVGLAPAAVHRRRIRAAATARAAAVGSTDAGAVRVTARLTTTRAPQIGPGAPAITAHLLPTSDGGNGRPVFGGDDGATAGTVARGSVPQIPAKPAAGAPPWSRPVPAWIDDHARTDWPIIDVDTGPVVVEVAVVDGAGRTASASAVIPVVRPAADAVQAIRTIAYLRWIDRGRVPGHDREDWTAAESQYLRPRVAVRAYYLGRQRAQGRDWGGPQDDWLRAEQLERLATMGS